MYPASRLAVPDRRPITSRALSTLAAVVLLIAALEIFYVFKPAPPHLVQYGQRVSGCAIRMNGPGPGDPIPPNYRREQCHLFVPDQHTAVRVGIGVGAVAIVLLLTTAATRASRNRPEFA